MGTRIRAMENSFQLQLVQADIAGHDRCFMLPSGPSCTAYKPTTGGHVTLVDGGRAAVVDSEYRYAPCALSMPATVH